MGVCVIMSEEEEETRTTTDRDDDEGLFGCGFCIPLPSLSLCCLSVVCCFLA